jgi:pilus assembly protein CpaB
MDVKKIALLIGALLIAVVTAVTARNIFIGAGAPDAAAAAVPQGPKILVARKALPVGTIIDQESLGYQAWPKELMQNAYYTEGSPDADMAKLLGTVVRNPITAGQPLTRGTLVGPADRGFLAAALGPGMRAVTVPVTQTSGGAGFIFPGDRVDVVLTQDVAGGGDGPPLKVSETIVRNMRVLATDQRTDSKGDDGKTEVKISNNVTLEATPKIAEKIQVAQSMGQIALSLRSISDSTAELERAVASGQVQLPKGTNPAEERRMLLAIANQPIDSGTTFTTGGDVSRFQRRTVPSKPVDRAAQGMAALNRLSGALASASGNRSAGASYPGGDSNTGAAVHTGPSVRVSRGNTVSYVPVGAR